MQAECPAASLVCELPAPPPGWLLPVAMAEPPREPGATAEHNAVDTAAAVTAVSAGPPDVAGVAAPGGATPVANGDDPFGFLVELHRVPCFRESVLYGGGGGALLGALHWQRTRNGERATDVAVKASLLFASAYWLMCRRNYRAQRAAVRTSIDAVGRVAAEGVALKERLGLAPPGLAPSATTAERRRSEGESGEGAGVFGPRQPPAPPAAGGGVGHA